MSLRDFWISVQTAARMVSPRASVDSPTLDPSRIEHDLGSADIWLTRGAVEGFAEEDVSFLSERERRVLSESVARFLRVAESVPSNAPASPDQVREALPQFAKIVEILRPDKYLDLDAFVIGKQIERLLEERLPVWVHGLRFQTGIDATEDPALWIWVELDDSAATDDVFSQNVKQVKTLLESAVRRVAPDRWPYVRFRTVSEQQAVSR